MRWLVLICLLAGCASVPSGPLYVDPSGWTIQAQQPGPEFIAAYANYRIAGGRLYALIRDSGLFVLYKEMFENKPESYWCFGLQLPEGTELVWNKGGGIILNGLQKGRPVQYVSLYLLFTNEGIWEGVPVPGNLLITNEQSAVSVAPFRGFLSPLHPENGNLFLVGKFDFTNGPPDQVLSCEVFGLERR